MTKKKEQVIERDTLEYFEENFVTYGSLTLQDRALPDYRDGLLKVHRRVLWSMYNIAKNNGAPVKSARIVGDVLGRYHPHGDSSVYSAMQFMAHSPEAPVEGTGNWGSQTDDAAAYRYTNARLSDYAANILCNRDYMPTVKLHDNYDGKDQEPELLPALLPNVLMSSVQGIAVGLATTMPSFTKDSLIALLKLMLKKKVSPKQATGILKMSFPFGGNAPLDEDWQENAEQLIKTGKGSIYVYCEYDVDAKAKTLHIKAVPPRMNPETLMDKLRNSGYFTSVQDCMGKDTVTGADIRCKFGRSVNVRDAIDDLEAGILVATVPYQIAVVSREWDPEVRKVKATIHQWGVIELLENWLAWRKELEAKMLSCRKGALEAEVSRKNLLLLAQENRKLIAQSWEQADQVAYLSKQLKLDAEDAKYIVGLRLSQLAKLDRDALQAELTDLKKRIAAVVKSQKDIDASVLANLNSL